MKKIFILFVLFYFFSSFSCFAMTKEELKEKIKNGYVINGEEFKLTEAQYIEVERYLNNNEISEKDINIISNKMDEAKNIIEDSGAKNISELPSEKKEELMGVVEDISSSTDIKISVNKDSISIYNSNGTLFTKVDDSVEYTDSFSPLVFASVILSILGLSIVTFKVVKENA